MPKTKTRKSQYHKLKDCYDKPSRYYQFECINPKHKITNDCSVRAIAKAMDRSYEEVYRELFEYSLITGYFVNDRSNFEKYLKSQGWVVHKQPKHSDNTKLTGKEFANMYGSEYPRCIVSIGAQHISCMYDGKFVDNWDCTDKKVGKYWVKPTMDWR